MSQNKMSSLPNLEQTLKDTAESARLTVMFRDLGLYTDNLAEIAKAQSQGNPLPVNQLVVHTKRTGIIYHLKQSTIMSIEI